MAKGLARSLVRPLFKGFSASFLMGFATYQFLDAFGSIFDIDTFWGIFLQGLCAGLIGIAVGVALLKLLRSRELEGILEGLRHKFWRAPAIAPEQGEL